MLKVIDCEQNSPAWFEARMGTPTASRFADIMSKGRGGNPSKVRQKYLMELASEIVTGEPMANFSTRHTQRGHDLEPEALRAYAFITHTEPVRVGFIKGPVAGCSPDSLIGDTGALEIKTKLPDLMVECLIAPDSEFPKEHYWQCMGILAVTAREWIDLAVYWPGFPLVIKRLERDEGKIKELCDALTTFRTDLDMIVSKVRAYGQQEKAA